MAFTPALALAKCRARQRGAAEDVHNPAYVTYRATGLQGQ